MLVSKSGFSGNALAAIDREAGRVQAFTPEVIEVNGEAVVKHLFTDTIEYKPTRCNVHVRNGDERIVVAGEPLMDVYAEDESLLGPLSYLVQDTVGLDNTVRLSFEAHQHPEKDQVKAFSITVVMPQLGYHLQQSETGQRDCCVGGEQDQAGLVDASSLSSSASPEVQLGQVLSVL